MDVMLVGVVANWYESWTKSYIMASFTQLGFMFFTEQHAIKIRNDEVDKRIRDKMQEVIDAGANLEGLGDPNVNRRAFSAFEYDIKDI